MDKFSLTSAAGNLARMTGCCLALLSFIPCVGTVKAAVNDQTKIDPWLIDSGPIDPAHYFGETVANGMIGISSVPRPFKVGRILLNGAYEPRALGAVDDTIRSLNFLSLKVAIDGVNIDWIGQTSGFHQTLDMKKAVLTTDFDYAGKATVKTALRSLRQMPYTAMLEVTVTAMRPITVSVDSMIECPGADKTVDGGDRSASRCVSEPYSHAIDVASGRTVQLVGMSTPGPLQRATIAASQAIMFDGTPDPILKQRANGSSFSVNLPAGSKLHFALVGSAMSSVTTPDPVNQAERLTATAWTDGIEPLIAGHEQEWARLWKSDITLEGDPKTERDIHSMLYHLYSFIREESHLSISPMGLSSDGYMGHIFWDAETWMFPPLLVLHPEMARSMLDYRVDRLPAARQNAFANGYRGAEFPWESAQSGREDIPMCCMPLEIHITADIGIAAWQYYLVTQDRQWLRTKGFPLLEATADFWASRVERTTPSSFSISHVVAADEYADDVANDAFTNAAARENLADAGRAAKLLGLTPNPEWQQVREHIPILKLPNGVTDEFAGYNGATIKQADVNLLAYPLHEIRDRQAIQRDLDYYAGRVDQTNGPAMTKSVLSILYERLGMPEKAREYFLDGYQPNLRPPFGAIAESATGNNPYFATGAGGLLQAMLFGFGGLDISEQGLVQHPMKLPKEWKSLKLTGIGVLRKEYSSQ